MEKEAKSENIIIRPEFLVRKKEVPVQEMDSNVVESADSAVAGGDDVGSKRKADSRDNDRNNRKKVALKDRHQSSHPKKEDRLCSFAAKGNPCNFGQSCSYSHDIKDYLSRKEPDLGPFCHQFETFGFCPNGIMCRFGGSHIDKDTGMNLSRPAEAGGVIERVNINVLSKEAQTMLRKKKYNRGVDRYVVNRKGNQSKQEQKKATEVAPAQPTETTVAPVQPSEVPGNVEVSAKEKADESSSGVPAVSPAVEPAQRETMRDDYSFTAYPERTVPLVDFTNKIYIAPLTTVGNLPFRRILKEYGADITCGEMAMANNIVSGQASEWALMRRHASEDCFGVQVAGGYTDTMSLTARILENEVKSDFVDLNSACPIDLVCNRGCGSAMMNKPNKLFEILSAMTAQLPSRSVTIKIRTGWSDKNPSAHELIPQLQRRFNSRLSAIFLHGRSRLQRYHKLANWEYVLQAAQSQDPSITRIPVVGNGDILSWEDWQSHQHMLEENIVRVASQAAKIAPDAPGATVDEIEGDRSTLGLASCAMLARGALIKPWLPQEIKEQRVIDIPATERLDILRKFCNYGLEHWGSDQQGVNNTRRFLLEWMSFLHRYVPAGILAQPYAQGMNQRPPHYFGRDDLETLLSSPSSADWIRVSEMFLGPVSPDYTFIPKHKSNSYAPEPAPTGASAGASAPVAAAEEDMPEG